MVDLYSFHSYGELLFASSPVTTDVSNRFIRKNLPVSWGEDTIRLSSQRAINNIRIEHQPSKTTLPTRRKEHENSITMVNPIPAGWQTLTSSMSSITRFKYDDDDNSGHEQERNQQQTTHRSHPVVFDTMVDETWQRRASSATSKNVRRQETIRNHEEEPAKQYFIHSQHQPSSWSKKVGSYLQSALILEHDDDNDALCWCE